MVAYPLRAQWIEQLFPKGVVAYSLGEDALPPALLPEEEQWVEVAVDKRRAEFARGRACARAACVELGEPPRAIPKDVGRAPLWPSGLTGSITHCRGLVAATVARTSGYSSLGLDAEPREGLEPDLAARISSEHERSRLDRLADIGPEVAARLLFSAKEVIHKCIQPTTGTSLDFFDVEVAFDVQKSGFRVEPVTSLARSVPEIDMITGRYLVTEDHLVAVGWITADSRTD